MIKSENLPEIRKEAFTKARENLGLSVKELSTKACLSVKQIQQLENGETNSFYGPQIKLTAAKKVARLLNLSDEDAFDLGSNVPPITAHVENVQLAQEQTKIIEKKSSRDFENEKKVEVIPEPGPLIQINQETTGRRQKRKVFLLLGVAAISAFSIVNLLPLFFPQAPKEESVIVQESVQESSPEVATTGVDKPAGPEQVSSPAMDATVVATVGGECPAVDITVASFRPEAPKKPGVVVYIQPKTTQTVCVIDASGKSQNKTLESGVGTSFFGKPPFKVLTQGLNQVDLYFQGAKVRTSAASKTIILEAAEIIQPTDLIDSQIR